MSLDNISVDCKVFTADEISALNGDPTTVLRKDNNTEDCK